MGEPHTQTWKKKNKYSLQQKNQLADRAVKIKQECDEKKKEAEIKWNSRKQKYEKVSQKSSEDGFLARTVRETFPELKHSPNNDPEFRKAVMVVHRAYQRKMKESETDSIFFKPSKSKFREFGGGRKSAAVEVRQALFEWFVDVRGSLKGRLPKKLFKWKCRQLYDRYLDENKSDDPEAEGESETQKIHFSDKWIKGWMTEYRVSLRKPNKRYSISAEDRKLRIIEFLKNVWRVRYFFNKIYGIEPVIRGGDQMPLHRNESSQQKTLNLTGAQAFVKENYSLSRERITVYTEVSTDDKNKLPIPEFLFKGKGTRTKLDPPEKVHCQWAPKGSYRLENMLETIKHIPNKHNLFSTKNYGIYLLDDYSVHVTEDVRKALLAKGWILIVLGGGITGDVQVNDTDIHRHLKAVYRDREALLMLEKLRHDPDKIPSPSRDELMDLLVKSWKDLEIDPQMAFNKNFITNNLDGTQDYLVRGEIFHIVGKEMIEFRNNLLSKDPPKNITELVKTITPPKGVHIPVAVTSSAANGSDSTSISEPIDEGCELLDGEQSDIEMETQMDSSDDDNDDVDMRELTNEESDSEHEEATGIQDVHPLMPSQFSSLNITDPDLQKDLKFLNDFKEFISTNKVNTSTQMLPFISCLGLKYTKAMISMKKRITADQEMTKRLINSDTFANTSREVEPATTSACADTDSDMTPESSVPGVSDVSGSSIVSMIAIGDWVLVDYDDARYPGEVKQIVDTSEGTNVEVSVMVRSGSNWKWPVREDVLWYSPDQLVRKIGHPLPLGSSSRCFSFDDTCM